MMKRIWFLILCAASLLGACSSPADAPPATPQVQASEPTAAPSLEPTDSEPPTATVADEPIDEAVADDTVGFSATPIVSRPDADPFPAQALPSGKGEYFAGSGICAVCHQQHTTQDGENVSIDVFWRGTMMANAARDPYWQASVRAETLSNPAYDAIIQDKCATCHMPMAHTAAAFSGEDSVMLDLGYSNPDNPAHTFAMDGVSCTLCHQIEPEKLGEDESYDGGFVIDAQLPAGERINYGPYDSPPGLARSMQSTAGFIPVRGPHLQSSEMCATCHTLFTPTVDGAGDVVGLFPEQTPYLEWLASDFSAQQSCQDCHMPEVAGKVQLSVTGGPMRSPFSRHSFVGGNTYALQLLRYFGPELGVTAASEQIESAIARAQVQLQEQTAHINIENLEVKEEMLHADLVIHSQAGHKLPTGYPSRRVWLHITVADPSGRVIFESGNWSADGLIIGNDNDMDPSAYEAHYEVLTNPEQVQIYEAIIANTDNEVTTTLLRGAGYLKDNRLLPQGFASDDANIAVYGGASSDLDFVAGGDTLKIALPLGDVPGPYTLTVELLYQSIGYRWAQNLAAFSAPEPQQFMRFYQAISNIPEIIVQTSVQVGE